MNNKLIIIVITGLATIGSLFLFSPNSPHPESQTASIIETMPTPNPSPTPTRFDLGSSKRSNLDNINSSVSSTLLPSPTPASTFTPAPTSSTVPSPILAPTPTPSQTSSPSQTPSPLSLNSSGFPVNTPTTTPTQSAKININTANQQELENITGVGPVIAQRIIDYRQSNGPFQKIEDIKNVKGIGDKTFEKMKNEITIS